MQINDFSSSIEIPSCKFNIMVECEKQEKCDRCGWNPKVFKKRIEEIRKKVNDE